MCEEQAKAGLNLLLGLRTHEAWRSRAVSIYEDLKELASGSHATPALRETQARAGNGLLTSLGEVEALWSRAVSVYEEIKGLASSPLTTSATLLEVHADAGANLCSDLSKVEAWRQRAVSIYEDLKDLALGHFSLTTLLERQARSGFNLIRGLGKDEAWRSRALSTYEDLKGMSSYLPVIREWQAKAAGAIIWRLCQDTALTEERLGQVYHAYVDLRGHRDVLSADLYRELLNLVTTVFRSVWPPTILAPKRSRRISCGTPLP